MNVDQLNLEVEVPEKNPKHSWENASDEEKENFRGTLQQLLENLNPPIIIIIYLFCKHGGTIYY